MREGIYLSYSDAMSTRLRTLSAIAAASLAASLGVWGFITIAAPVEPVVSAAAQQTQIEDQRAEDTFRQLEVTEAANARAAEEARIAAEVEAARVAAEAEAARVAAEAAAAEAARVAAEQAAAEAAAQAARPKTATPAPSNGWSTNNLDGGDAGKEEVAANCGIAGANTLPDGTVVCAG